MEITTKRIYEQPLQSDGYRVLVDRLWPRGMSKENACIKLWAKELAPSGDLRKWFGHREERWEAFKALYWQELQNNAAGVKEFEKETAGHDKITLLYAAKDQEHTHALILEKYLQKFLKNRNKISS